MPTIKAQPEVGAIISAIATLLRAAYIDDLPTEETRDFWKEVSHKARLALDSLAARASGRRPWFQGKPSKPGVYWSRVIGTTEASIVELDADELARPKRGDIEWQGPLEPTP